MKNNGMEGFLLGGGGDKCGVALQFCLLPLNSGSILGLVITHK